MYGVFRVFFEIFGFVTEFECCMQRIRGAHSPRICRVVLYTHKSPTRRNALATTTHSQRLNNNKNQLGDICQCAEPIHKIHAHQSRPVRSFVHQTRRAASARLSRVAFATAWHTHYVISITAGICTNVPHIVRWPLHLLSLVLLCAFRRFNICLRSSPMLTFKHDMPAPVYGACVCLCGVNVIINCLHCIIDIADTYSLTQQQHTCCAHTCRYKCCANTRRSLFDSVTAPSQCAPVRQANTHVHTQRRSAIYSNALPLLCQVHSSHTHKRINIYIHVRTAF